MALSFSQALGVKKGITTIIGGGGKTSLLHQLAMELGKDGARVIVSTTTHIFPFDDIPLLECKTDTTIDEILKALNMNGILCVGKPGPDGKLSAPPMEMDLFSGIADYVLVEADGSKHLPLKAHRAHEPVIPKGTDRTILVIGSQAVGLDVFHAAHCPELYADISGTKLTEQISPEMVARVIRYEKLGDIIFVNAAETEERVSFGERLAGYVMMPTVIGSLQEGRIIC